LIEEHPNEDGVILRNRVLGGLMPTRAFGRHYDTHIDHQGDARYKWPREVQDKLAAAGLLRKKTPTNLKTPPYVTAGKSLRRFLNSLKSACGHALQTWQRGTVSCHGNRWSLW